jgi:hypothetical protein
MLALCLLRHARFSREKPRENQEESQLTQNGGNSQRFASSPEGTLLVTTLFFARFFGRTLSCSPVFKTWRVFKQVETSSKSAIFWPVSH